MLHIRHICDSFTISVPHCRMIRVNLSTLVQLSLKLSLPPGNALTILPTPGM